MKWLNAIYEMHGAKYRNDITIRPILIRFVLNFTGKGLLLNIQSNFRGSIVTFFCLFVIKWNQKQQLNPTARVKIKQAQIFTKTLLEKKRETEIFQLHARNQL